MTIYLTKFVDSFYPKIYIPDIHLERCAVAFLTKHNDFAVNAFLAFGGNFSRLEHFASKLHTPLTGKRPSSPGPENQHEAIKEIAHTILFSTKKKELPPVISAMVSSKKSLEILIDEFKSSFHNHALPETKKLLLDRLNIIMEHYYISGDMKTETNRAIQKLLGDKRIDVVKEAIKFGKFSLVQRLTEFPDDLDYFDIDNNSLLITAILSGHIPIIEYLINKGANVNRMGQHDMSPLCFACLTGNMQVYQLLLSKGANFSNSFLYAIEGGNLEIVNDLLKRKINPTLWGKSYKPIHIAMLFGRDEIVKRLMPYEHPLLPSLFIQEKFLCHRFGLNTTFSLTSGRFIEMEGLISIATHAELRKSLEGYLEHLPKDTKLPQGFSWKKILDIFSTALTNRKNIHYAFSRENPMDLIPFLTGWQGHATALLINKANNRYALAKGNRGQAAEGMPGLRVSEVAYPENLEGSVGHLMEHKESVLGLQIFLNELNESLGLSEIDYQYFEQKYQKAGTCSWASAKTLLLGIIYFELLNLGYSGQEAREISRELYKDWSTYDRVKAVDNFLGAYDKLMALPVPPSLDILKNNGIIPVKIMEQVAWKCKRPALKNSFMRIIEKFPELIKSQEILFHAIHYEDALKYLDAKGADFKQQGLYGESMLHHAASHAQTADAIPFLLQKGLNPMEKDNKGFTPIAIAYRASNVKAIQHFLRLVPNCKLTEGYPDSSLLTKALESRNPEILSMTMKYAKINQRGSAQIKKFLKKNRILPPAKCLRIILENTRGLNLNIEDENGDTLLMKCCRNPGENCDKLKTLIELTRKHGHILDVDMNKITASAVWTEEMKDNLATAMKMLEFVDAQSISKIPKVS